MSLNIISNTDPGNVGADGVYTAIDDSQPVVTPGPATGLYAIVGGGNDGEEDTFGTFTDDVSMLAEVGDDTTSANSIARAALSAMPECQLFGYVRRVDGTQVAATITVPCAGVQATGQIQIGGTPHAGDTIAVAVNNNSAGWISASPYTVKTGDTIALVALGVAAALNASAPVTGSPAILSPAAANGANVLLGAAAPGAAGNSIATRAVATGGHTTVTAPANLASGADPSGNSHIFVRKCSGSRANQGTALCTLQQGQWFYNPIVTATLTYPNAPSETFTGIVAYATPGGGFDHATFVANLLAQVNNKVRNVPGSSRWTAVASSGAQPPVSSSVQATGGTDGTAGLTTTSVILGTDGLTGKTGMFALRDHISGAQFAIAGLTDPAAAQLLQQFAVQENAIAHFSYPEGTQTQDALNMRSQYDIVGSSLITDMDWDEVDDLISGQVMYVPPQDKIAGVIASVPAYVYPGNQPIRGVSGIDSTDHIIGGVNTVIGNEPATRQKAGLLSLSYMPRNPRGPQLGLPHGLMSDGVTPISDVRMLKYIIAVLEERFGQVIGEGMNTDPTDPDFLNPARNDCVRIARQFLGGLKIAKQITGWRFLIGNDNTQATSQTGFLIPRTIVTTLSPAQYILNIARVGRTVSTTAVAA